MRACLSFLIIGTIILVISSEAAAFDRCTSVGSPVTLGHWPDPTNINNFGTHKWEFDWKVGMEGLEVDNVRYTADLNQPMKMVMRRGSLPFLPVHYPSNAALVCDADNRGGHGFNDQLNTSALSFANPFCCAHVPTTLCNLPDRTMACSPKTGVLDTSTCPGGSIACHGVCVGTQFDNVPPIEDGIGEFVSGSSTADVVISASFKLGGYEFVQRWRFTDDGMILSSIRLGGIHDCELHTHQVYWRFNFELVNGGVGQNEAIEQCDLGGCPDVGSTGWAGESCACGIRPTPKTSWRVSDGGVPGRSIVIESALTEGSAATFCQNQSDCGSGGCLNTHDFCALPAAEPFETFVTDKCNDHLPAACPSASLGPDTAFWYFGHVDNHDPCTYLPMCDPAPGTEAFGPTIRLVGSW